MSKNSYSNSHLTKDFGIRYNSGYSKDTHDHRLWLLEKEVLRRIMLKYFKLKVKNYLDFACGTGRLLEVFENNSINSSGIDISKEMLKEAKKKYKKSKLIQGDLTKNPYLFKQKFDLITAFRFFLNAEDSLRKKALIALYKNLKDDGILIINIHGNKYSIRHLSLLFRKIFSKAKLNEMSYLKLKMLLKENKFKIIELYGIGFLPYILSHYLTKKVWLKLERFLIKLKFLNLFGIDLILVCKKILKK